MTVEYDENNRPARIDTIVVSTQHSPEVTLEQIRRDIIEYVVKPTVPENLLDNCTKYFINPTGRFVIGGLTATAVSPAEKSLWTPTAVMRLTAAEPSPARTPLRLTAAQPMQHAT